MTLIVWLVIAFVFIIFEIMTPSVFFFFCLFIGSIFAAIVSYFGVSILVEFLVFVVVSILSVYFIRPVFRKIISRHESVNSNVDALIGEKVIVIEKITPLKVGFVRVAGEIWRAESDIKLEIGEVVEVRNVKGTTLMVKKII